MNTNRPMTAAREKRILIGIGKRRVKNIDKWAKSFARHLTNINESK